MYLGRQNIKKIKEKISTKFTLLSCEYEGKEMGQAGQRKGFKADGSDV